MRILSVYMFTERMCILRAFNFFEPEQGSVSEFGYRLHAERPLFGWYTRDTYHHQLLV